MFCEGVQYSLRFCLDHLNCVKTGGLLVLYSIGETEKSWVGGERQSYCFFSKIPWWKRKCETAICRDVTASYFVAEVLVEVFTHFHAVTGETLQQYTGLTVWSARTNSLWTLAFMAKKSDEHALHFALHLSRFFRSRWVWTFRVRFMFFPNALVIIARVSVEHFRDFHRILMHTRCRIHREIALGQIHDCK
jgi:hypothetical protein